MTAMVVAIDGERIHLVPHCHDVCTLRPTILETFGMFESLNEALIECVRACGGSKAVGMALWPTKGVEAAQRHLLACLNSERHEKLGPDELLHLMRQGRERGCHAVMQHLAAALSYAELVPIEPKDEADELRRRLLEMGRELQMGLAKLEKLERPLAAVRAIG